MFSSDILAVDDGTVSATGVTSRTLTESVAVDDGTVIVGESRTLEESVAVSDGTVSATGTLLVTCKQLFCIIWSGLVS